MIEQFTCRVNLMSNSLGDLTDVHVTTVTVEIYIDKHIAIGIIVMYMFWFYLH